MTIEYSLTRTEIVRGFFRSLSNPRFLFTVSCYALGMGIVVLVSTGAFFRPLVLRDAYTLLIAAAGFMVFLPIFLFIRAKTAKRSLTISPEGISTEIGSLKGDILWKQVKVISQGRDFILIARTGGNAFFIPVLAFSGLEDKNSFFIQATEWANRTRVV
ncbi:MAG: YcxB family protein [Edaphobacter sp.]